MLDSEYARYVEDLDRAQDRVDAAQADLDEAKAALRRLVERAYEAGIRSCPGYRLQRPQPARSIDIAAWTERDPDGRFAWERWARERSTPSPSLRSVREWAEDELGEDMAEGYLDAITHVEDGTLPPVRLVRTRGGEE